MTIMHWSLLVGILLCSSGIGFIVARTITMRAFLWRGCALVLLGAAGISLFFEHWRLASAFLGASLGLSSAAVPWTRRRWISVAVIVLVGSLVQLHLALGRRPPSLGLTQLVLVVAIGSYTFATLRTSISRGILIAATALTIATYAGVSGSWWFGVALGGCSLAALYALIFERATSR